ncbi:hypothetical protein F5Y17DRAFT_444112 [Xylariaceae sp. FL0594]|nr:hypothetical protein F5Y17DRAFT_444112 [Xylariaceae sp. FL0594]
MQMDMDQGSQRDDVPIVFHDVDFTMREYYELQDQHEELRQWLSTLSSSSNMSSPGSFPNDGNFFTSLKPTETSSLSPPRSPIDEPRTTTSSGLSTTTCRSTCSTADGVAAAPEGWNNSIAEGVAAGEQMLSTINEGIKRALTELLNCDAVRQDMRTRAWVQTRLLETERELRNGRRRRSSGSSNSSAASD